MTLELLCTVLACSSDSFLEANAHKVLVATVGFSFLTAAFFVRQHRYASGGKGHAFEVLIDPPRQTSGAATRPPNVH